MQKNDNYCPYLWELIQIFPNGDVFLCCIPLHTALKDNKIGNINEKSLKDIWNSPKAKTIRKSSLEGNLPCYEKCKIWKNKDIYERKSLDSGYENLRYLELGLSEACNIRCKMCFQKHDSKIRLETSKIIENIDFSPFEDICLWGGEPLFIENAEEVFDYITLECRKKVSMETNGLLLTDRWAEKIARYSNYILFSINAATKETHEKINIGSDWEKVLSNVKKINRYKSKIGSDLKIVGHMTIVKENIHEVSKFIREFKSLGFDHADLNYDEKIRRFLEDNPELRKKLGKNLKEALNDAEIDNIDISEIKSLGII